ncbi:MAG: DEAD/DEAH box helicase, partial [Spirochaeta sp.]
MNIPSRPSVQDDPLASFHPLLAVWFREQIGVPTPVQKQAWPVIGRGGHCLITAPTGTGKTLAAFLTAIDGRIRGESGRILYISPLKALNSDIERNLQQPLQQLRTRFASAGEHFPDIRIGVRSGDTGSTERRRLNTHPPDILVTTPESLNLMLSSKSGRQGLKGISVVILDEIHAILSSKRGTYLMSAVERLTGICGDFQRIALSATVHPLRLVAEIVGGLQRYGGGGTGEIGYTPRPVEIVEVKGNKSYQLEVGYPEGGGLPGETEEWWRAIAQTVRQRIESNNSTIIFANSRRMVEKLARMVNDTPGAPVYAHHGSLSKEIRRVVEERLKHGELKAIIATGSLELGIDIGEVDEIILLQSPFSISSGIQRVGRAGHGVGDVSRGLLLPIHSRDLIELAVMSEAVRDSASEAIAPPDKP